MSSPQVSRRTVARGAAWAAPIAAVGVAAPAFAVSAAPPAKVITSLCGCGSGINRVFKVTATFTGSTVAFNLTNITAAIGNQTGIGVSPSSLAVPAGPGTTTQTFTFVRNNNGTFTSVTLDYTATATGGQPIAQSVTLTTAAAPNCGTCP